MTDVPATPQRSPILPIFLIVLVDVFGMTLVLPLLTVYAEDKRFNATPFLAMMLVSVYAACQLFSGPVIGRISDRVGRKPMLLMSQAGTLIGFLVMARAQSLWMLFLARVIDGATAGNISLAQAYISDNTEAKNRAKSFALIGIAFGVGFFVGPMLSGWLADHYHDLNAPVYLAAGMSALSILGTATMLRGGAPPQLATEAQLNPGPGGRRVSVFDARTYIQYFQRPLIRGLLLEFVAYIFCFSLFLSGFALFAERRFTWRGRSFGPREIGLVFGYIGLLGIIFQGGLIGRLVKRFGERRLATAGFISLVVGYFGLGFAYTIPVLLVVGAIATFGNSIVRAVLTSMVTQHVGRHEQGTVLGLMQSLNSMASILAPTLGGLLIESSLLNWWAWTAAATASIGLVLALFSGAAGQPGSTVPVDADAPPAANQVN